MKYSALLLILTLSTAHCHAYDHPAEAAEAKLEQAKKDFSVAKARLDAAVSAISHPPKKKDALASLEKMEKDWAELGTSMSLFRIAASPALETSTSSSLIPFYTETEILSHRTKLYLDLSEWIEVNWKK